MNIPITLLGPFAAYTTKSGKQSYCAPCSFADDGARYPVGRGMVYAATSPATPPKVARLVSYDRGEARFAV